ncbi:MAG: hypothetical protein Q9186_002274 [Xanthomendoza sp. 1 TL-2023]
MPKRKSSTAVAQSTPVQDPPLQISAVDHGPPPKRAARGSRSSGRKASTNPDKNANVLDAPEAFRASPDADTKDERIDLEKMFNKETDDSLPSLVENGDSDTPLSELSDIDSVTEENAPPAKAPKKGGKAKRAQVTDEKPAVPAKAKKPDAKEPQFLDPEAEDEEEADEEEIKAALSRPPPVNSGVLPLPWKGRLGYACLNTYLRFSNPPVFSSRTCRIASILENRHPLSHPNEPPHATKNRPDREQPASVRRGQEFVEQLCLANIRDIPKMLRWNDRYGIKFMRLSSEMFPFASHPEYGYKLAPFASEALAEVGKVAGELGHRLTTHPGQFTQLGSPRKPVIDNALRDLDYHTELLSLLKLPPQQDRDAVMILHLGGVFGDKEATLARFRENYAILPQGAKDRLVLENDDVSWSVHDLLPLCEELNIPMVLDFHHHNIIFDSTQIREGTEDIIDLYPRIMATWKRKKITPKMHYSEPTPEAITGRQRRKHNPRVATLPPCPNKMDLMIEAKDKEQAVFELMRTFKLPGFETFNDIIPHVRKDDNKPVKPPAKKKTPKKKTKKQQEEEEDEDSAAADDEEPAQQQQVIAEDEVGMGGPDGRVYWPPGQEHWLRPVKKVVKPKTDNKKAAPPGKELDEKGRIVTAAMKRKRVKEEEDAVNRAQKEGEEMARKVEESVDVKGEEGIEGMAVEKTVSKAKAKGGKAKVQSNAHVGAKGKAKGKARGKDSVKVEEEEPVVTAAKLGRRQSTRGKKVGYAEDEGSEELEFTMLI